MVLRVNTDTHSLLLMTQLYSHFEWKLSPSHNNKSHLLEYRTCTTFRLFCSFRLFYPYNFFTPINNSPCIRVLLQEDGTQACKWALFWTIWIQSTIFSKCSKNVFKIIILILVLPLSYNSNCHFYNKTISIYAC